MSMPSNLLKLLNGLVIVLSIALCAMLLLVRLPGMELLGIGPNWLLIWVVSWSIKRTVWQGLLAGVTLGLIHDGMTAVYPSHILSLVLVGVLTASLRRQLYLQENLISVVLIVFFMVIVAETAIAIQYSLVYVRPLREIWQDYQRIAIASATLSSLWAPALYYPLNQWWTNLRKLEK